MATDKNARVEHRNWAVVKPICHPNAAWALHHSIVAGIYTLACTECGKELCSVMVQPKQW